ncbi:MAG: Hpt domain-containing protein [Eubacterium aggregans]|uniref:Hpt domain-containing protein n=1 Tax=Eubacterium aggregans TaxID=81409 RepID=UPI002B211EC2|nr:Hpt domain-containing protein [Eubacterium aggregans]MEA5073467.1 Hpt domain-containing protein [Eubacterium aggregans]
MDIEFLKQNGIDYIDGLKRFSGKDVLYRKYLKRFLEDSTYGQLKTAMDQEEYQEAFLLAHTLKGVVGNLSFFFLLKHIEPFVEALREGKDIPLAIACFQDIEVDYEQTIQALKTIE